jgi:hypothetical protein
MRSAARIQAEIDTIEAHLASADSLRRSAGSDGTNLTNESRKELSEQLDRLYAQLGRANGTNPMFARGRVRGL